MVQYDYMKKSIRDTRVNVYNMENNKYKNISYDSDIKKGIKITLIEY